MVNFLFMMNGVALVIGAFIEYQRVFKEETNEEKGF